MLGAHILVYYTHNFGAIGSKNYIYIYLFIYKNIFPQQGKFPNLAKF